MKRLEEEKAHQRGQKRVSRERRTGGKTKYGDRMSGGNSERRDRPGGRRASGETEDGGAAVSDHTPHTVITGKEQIGRFCESHLPLCAPASLSVLPKTPRWR